MRHYGIVRRWGRISPHLSDSRVVAALDRDMAILVEGDGQFYAPGDLPAKHCVLNRTPGCPWWDYACFASCHWLVNFNLRLVELAEPGRAWRIVRSDEHSTVWDGDNTLFDINTEWSLSKAPPSMRSYWTANKVWERVMGLGHRILRPGTARRLKVAVPLPRV